MRALNLFFYSPPIGAYPPYISLNEVNDGVRMHVELAMRAENGDTALLAVPEAELAHLRDRISIYLAKRQREG